MGSSRLVKYRIGLMRPKRVPQTQGIVFGRDDATKSSGDTTTALQKECRVPANGRLSSSPSQTTRYSFLSLFQTTAGE
jgi:hypothetical protein